MNIGSLTSLAQSQAGEAKMTQDHAASPLQFMQQALSQALFDRGSRGSDTDRSDPIRSKRPQDEWREPTILPVSAQYAYTEILAHTQRTRQSSAATHLGQQSFDESRLAAALPATDERDIRAVQMSSSENRTATSALSPSLADRDWTSYDVSRRDAAENDRSIELDKRNIAPVDLLPHPMTHRVSMPSIAVDTMPSLTPVAAAGIGHQAISAPIEQQEVVPESSRIEMTYRLATWSPEASVALSFDYAEPEAGVTATASDERVRDVLEDALAATDGGAEPPPVKLGDRVLEDLLPGKQEDQQDRRPRWVYPDEADE